LISNVIGKVHHQPGPPAQVLTPDGMIMERFRDAGKPWKRPWVGGRGLWEAPVQHRGHVCRGVEFATDGRCVQVQKWVFTGLGRQVSRCARRVSQDCWLVRSGTTSSARLSSI
jgi:hypothetical protein